MINIPQNPNLCKITYNRAEKCYIVRNGREIARFPSGPKNKIKAQWAALAHDGREVHDAALDFLAEHPGIEGLEMRTLKAARMIQTGHLTNLTENNGEFRALVRSESQTDLSYNVRFGGIAPHCDCEDFERGQANRFGYQRPGAPHVPGIGITCKHVLVVILAQRLASEREQQAQRKQADKRAPHATGETNAQRILREARETNERGAATLAFALKPAGDTGHFHGSARINGWNY